MIWTTEINCLVDIRPAIVVAVASTVVIDSISHKLLWALSDAILTFLRNTLARSNAAQLNS